MSVLSNDPLKHQMEHFGAVVRGEAEPLVTARDGLANLRVTEAIVSAARSGATIELSLQIPSAMTLCNDPLKGTP